MERHGLPTYRWAATGLPRENFKNHVLQIIDNVYLTTDKVDYTFGLT